jgi:16S rRNA (cytidine1402-2'-O)-methyltransferase
METSDPVRRSKRWEGLAVVATPIGNLGDISARAIATLREADQIACEDTRMTARLCRAYDIETRLTPYHEHNAERVRPELLRLMAAGGRLALVSDAGTPLISDPGYKLVREAQEAGIPVTAIPGASAVTAALAVAGLPTDRFLFAGFAPAKTTARRRFLTELAATPATLVLFESARRLAPALADLRDALGPRPAAICRELTKLHEEIRRGNLGELAAHYADSGAPKGEIVIVIGPPESLPAAEEDPALLDALLRDALAEASLRDAVARVAAESGLPRREVYLRALALCRDQETSEKPEDDPAP